jgi:hypothetical protein
MIRDLNPAWLRIGQTDDMAPDLQSRIVIEQLSASERRRSAVAGSAPDHRY